MEATAKVVGIESEKSWDSLVARSNREGLPLIAHFTTSWCPPSVAMNPVFEVLAGAHEDAIFVLVDVDDLKGVASRLRVKAMPTFLFIKDGEVLDKLVGANPEELKNRVEGFVLSSSSGSTCDTSLLV